MRSNSIEQGISKFLSIPRTRRQFCELGACLGVAMVEGASIGYLVNVSPKKEQAKKELEGQRPADQVLQTANQILLFEKNIPGSYDSQTVRNANEIKAQETSYEAQLNNLYEKRGINKANSITSKTTVSGLILFFGSMILRSQFANKK